MIMEPERIKINGDMVRLARESRGHSQIKVSKSLGIAQGKLSKIESGVVDASVELLEQLEKSLGYPRTFFTQDLPLSGATLSYNRKRMSLAKGLLDKIRAEINIRRQHLETLLQSVESEVDSRWNIPVLNIEDHQEQPEVVARMVRAHWGVPAGPISSVTKLIESGNGLVVEMDFGTDKIDAEVYPFSNIGAIFFVSNKAPADRLRFNLSHELGHAVMHRHLNPDVEDQANRFAAEFLMPEQDIKPYFKRRVTLEMLAELKPIWRVSMATLLQRAFVLGAITDRQKKYLWMQMSSCGYRVREPANLDFPREKPLKLRSLLKCHLEELGYSEEELASTLRLFVDEFRQIYGSNFDEPNGNMPRLKLVTGSRIETKIS